MTAPSRALHAFACFTAASTFFLVFAGGMVTSTGSGLAVPDWPLSYGMLMPPMVGGIFYEHGHRMVAGAVGLLTLALLIWVLRREPRRWVRLLTAASFAAVVLQALLGGLTVILLLPTVVSTAHATLGQTFFCLTVTIALVTSPRWSRSGTGAVGGGAASPPGEAAATAVTGRRLRALAVVAFASVYLQLILGAVMRHMEAGLAIPDFPLVFGGVLPPAWTAPIAIAFAHRAWGILVGALVLTLGMRCLRWGGRPAEALLPAATLAALVPAQVALGGLTVLTARQPIVATTHVVFGAAILATCLVLAIHIWRPALEEQHARRAVAST